MKKSILILVVIAMCFTLVFAVTACKDPSDTINDLLNENGDETEGENQIEFMTQEEIESNFTNGYLKIKITTVSSEEEQNDITYVTVAENDTGVFYEMMGTQVYFDKTTSSMYLIGEDSKMFLGTDTESAESSIESIFTTYLASYTIYEDDTSYFTKAGTYTIAGRECTKYSYTPYSLAGGLSGLIGSAITDSTFEYAYYIDETNGLCLKFEVSGSSEEESGGVTWEVIELTLGDVDLSEYADLPVEDPFVEVED